MIRFTRWLYFIPCVSLNFTVVEYTGHCAPTSDNIQEDLVGVFFSRISTFKDLDLPSCHNLVLSISPWSLKV
jgi:hypothetical protein